MMIRYRGVASGGVAKRGVRALNGIEVLYLGLFPSQAQGSPWANNYRPYRAGQRMYNSMQCPVPSPDPVLRDPADPDEVDPERMLGSSRDPAIATPSACSTPRLADHHHHQA
jgi:hypothetical protein